MKILYHHRIGSFDGQAIHIQELIRALRAAGCSVVVVGPSVLEKLRAGRSLAMIGRLKRWLPRTAYEGLEAAYAVPSFLRLLWAWLRHRPDLIYERYNLFQPAGAWLKRSVGIPLVLEVNAPLRHERSIEGGVALQGLAGWSERFVLRSADKIVAVSQALADILAAEGAERNRLLVLPNGVPQGYLDARLDEIAAKAALGLAEQFVIGFVGFPREWHRLDRIVDLIGRHGSEHGLHLLVVGDGPGVARLRQRAEELGVTHSLTVTGAVPHDRVIDYVSAFDIAVQPGVTAYASPLKILEYMALGRAIVAPNMANIRELLMDEESALLFDPEDLSSLDDAVLRLCRSPQLRKRLGCNAQRRLRENEYTWQANAARVLGLARNLSGKTESDGRIA